MTLELTAIRLAFLAGIVGVMSPSCWWPRVRSSSSIAWATASLLRSRGYGQDSIRSFSVMLPYGIGTGGVLLGAGLVSGRLLSRILSGGAGKLGKRILGWTVLALGMLVLLGVDTWLEAWAVDLLPRWVFTL